MRRLLVALVTVLCLALPASAAAYNPLSDACGAGGGAAGTTACSANGSDPVSGKNGILMKASLVLATLAGVTAVIIILYGAFRYVSSAGDPQKTASARSAIIGSAVGLVIIVTAEGIVIFVVSKL